MHPCTYGKKVGNKCKKWLDGFYTIKDKTLSLYNAKNTCLFSLGRSSYTEVESGYETDTYIIYIEREEPSIEGSQTSNIAEIVPETPKEILQKESVQKLVGRENEEIIDLFE